MKTLCHYISELAHGDKSREFLNKPVNNLSLTANDGGGAISITYKKTPLNIWWFQNKVLPLQLIRCCQ